MSSKQATMFIDNNKKAKHPTSETNYDLMCKESYKIPKRYNIFASFYNWILLAGFIVFPGTFTKLGSVTMSTEAGKAGQVVQAAVKNIPLIAIAVCCCIGGAFGMYWLWRKWRTNYEWLLNHIFM